MLGKDILVGITGCVFMAKGNWQRKGKGIKRKKGIFGTFIYENKGN
jgi:hypothetical protein